ncbi:MAG: hypothetical protein NC826_04995 [Candidatus Omnitrophica bacterium]|nr:hypothetical protein [Candidatus Omnitrophota bacterium]
MNKKKAQSILEYSFFLAAVIAAFVGIFFLFKAYTQGKFREAADAIGGGGQYVPPP